MMQHKSLRITLVVIEVFVGVWALIGGVGLVTGTIAFLQMPVKYLQGTPFSGYTIPGLLLFFAVGGSYLFAAATILTRSEVGILASALASLLLVGFEAVEVAIIDRDAATLPTAVPQQIMMTVLALACFGLAAFLWMKEFRGHSALTRQTSHA